MNRRMFLTLPPLAAPLLLRAPLFAAGPSLPLPRQRIDCFGRHWLVQAAAEWKTESAAGGEVLQLSVARPQEANPRAPVQYALLEQEPAGCFTLDVEVQGSAASTSLIIVYAWKDPLHFNYVHLSTDTPLMRMLFSITRPGGINDHQPAHKQVARKKVVRAATLPAGSMVSYSKERIEKLKPKP